MASAWIHAVSSEPRCSNGVFRKLSRGNFFAKHRRHATFPEQDGEAKTSKNHGKFLDSRCFVATSLFEGRVSKTFSRENFCKAYAPHSVSRARRGSEKKQKPWQVPGFAPFTGREREAPRKRAKIKISREFCLLFTYKNHPVVGWSKFLNPLCSCCVLLLFPVRLGFSRSSFLIHT